MVSTPPVPPRGPEDRDADDPTGIRALLSGLGDPGPMPADLVDRINASIAAEQAARGQGSSVVPMRRRVPGWQKYGLVAAAVAGLAVGVPALLGTGPQDVMASLSRSSDQSGAAASSAEKVAPPIASFTPAAPGSSGSGARATSAVGTVTMVATGTGYTSSELAEQARTTMLGPFDGSSPGSAGQGRATGALDAAGLRECLTAMGVPAWMPVVGDVATFDGSRAVVAVVSSDTGQDAYAVPTWCDATHARALAGPVRIR
ncbi:hypothetical protein GCM10025782_08510 [Pedococcus ginsenosidimutans]|uniref:Uncharacterized protein n=1 Tax=Pedococcus ginsenosidimutans TaxID=490570 RepID=A0ABP8XT80_9MICO